MSVKQALKEKMVDLLDSWGLRPSPAPRGDSQRRLMLYLPEPDGSRVQVGVLTQESGEFVFRYSDEFRARNDLPALPAFPEKDEEYRSDHLWPIFEMRLPPTDRPDVERVIRERHLQSADKLQLLAELGRRTITTPFEFELQKA